MAVAMHSKACRKLEGVGVQWRPELPPALTDCTLSINAGERVGVVGRTGDSEQRPDL